MFCTIIRLIERKRKKKYQIKMNEKKRRKNVTKHFVVIFNDIKFALVISEAY